MISIINLTKRFGGLTAVDGLNIEVKRGELYGILGPNGAGKTTVVRILCGALKPTEGTVEINGLGIHKRPLEVKAMLGYLPEEPNFYERLTAREILRFFSRLYGVEHENRVDELLGMVGLLERGDSKIATFSKGMRQRLAIARALLHDPSVLVLDEPTMGLDPEGARSMRDFIAEQKGEKTILMCTHYMNEAEELCDRIGIMNRGKLLAEGTSEQLKGMVKSGDGSKGIDLEDVFVRLVRGK
ncbi:MAG: ABC transporter ATP-binding protein [Candidatus Hydrothermarchaeaceae archaeon]